jgi:hypothetical protein
MPVRAAYMRYIRRLVHSAHFHVDAMAMKTVISTATMVGVFNCVEPRAGPPGS